MEKKEIKIDKCRFIGDSHINDAVFTHYDGTKRKCTQDDVIELLVRFKRHIKGGRKLDLGDNNTRVSYLIDYGIKENEPKEMIKITFDKSNLLLGDANAVAIDSICQYAVTVRKNNIKKKIRSVAAMVLVTSSLVGTAVGLGYAEIQKNKYQPDKSEIIVQEENNNLDNGLENLIFEEDLNAKSR